MSSEWPYDTIIGIVTNGLLLDHDVTQFCVSNKVAVTISLDATEPSSQAASMRHPNVRLAKTVLDNLVAAHAQGLAPTVQTTYCLEHLDSQISPTSLLQQLRSIGIKSAHIMPAFNVLNGASPEQLVWLEGEYKKAAEFSVRSIYENDPIILVYVLKIMSRLLKKTEGHFICGAGIDSLTVMPSGDVYPCYLLYRKDQLISNINTVSPEETIEKMAENSRHFKNYKKANIAECTKCWARTLCASCYGPKFLANGSFSAPDQGFCRTLRASCEGVLSGLVCISSDTKAWTVFCSRLSQTLESSGQPVLLGGSLRGEPESV